jgi:hypothetical protein
MPPLVQDEIYEILERFGVVPAPKLPAIPALVTKLRARGCGIRVEWDEGAINGATAYVTRRGLTFRVSHADDGVALACAGARCLAETQSRQLRLFSEVAEVAGPDDVTEETPGVDQPLQATNPEQDFSSEEWNRLNALAKRLREQGIGEVTGELENPPEPEVWPTCPDCHGTGEVERRDGGGHDECSRCGGRGTVPPDAGEPPESDGGMGVCPDCSGTGIRFAPEDGAPATTCARCTGSGVLPLASGGTPDATWLEGAVIDGDETNGDERATEPVAADTTLRSYEDAPDTVLRLRDEYLAALAAGNRRSIKRLRTELLQAGYADPLDEPAPPPEEPPAE